MSRARMVVTAVLAVALLCLFFWQIKREGQVRACLDNGGAWNGNRCGPLPIRPILQRDLHRS